MRDECLNETLFASMWVAITIYGRQAEIDRFKYLCIVPTLSDDEDEDNLVFDEQRTVWIESDTIAEDVWNFRESKIQQPCTYWFAFDTCARFPTEVFESLAKMFPSLAFDCNCIADNDSSMGFGWLNPPPGGEEFRDNYAVPKGYWTKRSWRKRRPKAEVRHQARVAELKRALREAEEAELVRRQGTQGITDIAEVEVHAQRGCDVRSIVEPATGQVHDGSDLPAYRLPKFWRDASFVWSALPASWLGKAGWHGELFLAMAINGVRRPSPVDIRASETVFHQGVTVGTATRCWEHATVFDPGDDSTMDAVLEPVLRRLIDAFGSPDALRSAALEFVDARLVQSGADPAYLRRFMEERDKLAIEVGAD